MPLGTEVDLGQGNIVLDGDWDPASPEKKGTQRPPPFWPMSIVCDQTFDHLSYCLALVVRYYGRPIGQAIIFLPCGVFFLSTFFIA